MTLLLPFKARLVVTMVSFALGFGYQVQVMGLYHGLLPSGLPPFSSQAH